MVAGGDYRRQSALKRTPVIFRGYGNRSRQQCSNIQRMRKYPENILDNQKLWQYFGNFQVGARNLKYSGNTFEKQYDIGNLEDKE